MIFTELRFLLFFGGVFAVCWSLESNAARKVWLLAMSFVFYAAWDWRFLSLIVISILVDYFVGLGLSVAERASSRRLLLSASLTANLGLLGFFKYFGFFVDSAIDFGASLGFTMTRPALEVVLPVGISFYTFQTLSYSIDVYRRKLEPTRNLLDLALFVAFFPQLVAGPIVRAKAFLPQLRRAALWAEVRVIPHLVLFLFGFIKKSCVSDNIAPLVDAYFASPQSHSAAAAWLAVVLYAIQIYCDFSGYSDMAIATAGLLGYDLGPNFRYPYLATSLREFWQRWHISLSTWLRDYLYIPLGGNRGTTLATYRNLLLTMLLGGLWHGAAWHFVLWGALHGGALAVHRRFSELFSEMRVARGLTPQPASRVTTVVGWLATQYWVCFAWIFFRAQDLPDALAIAKAFVLFDSAGTTGLDPRWWFLVVLFGAAHWASASLEQYLFAPGTATKSSIERWPRWAFAIVYGAAVALTLLFVSVDVQPFIYFQF